MRPIYFSLLLIFLVSSCSQEKLNNVFDAKDLHSWNTVLIETVRQDLLPPIIASRVYTYPQVAMYIAASYGDTALSPIDDKLNGFKLTVNVPEKSKIDYSIAMLSAWSVVSKKMVFTEDNIEKCKQEFLKRTEKMNKDVVKNSLELGEQIGKDVIEWMEKDNYTETRTFPRYKIIETDSTWTQTPPDYPDAIEPYWNQIRPMIIDDLTQFKPEPPPLFSTDSTSDFYKMVVEVYDSSLTLTEDQKNTAWYWDDNPSDYINQGHLTHFVHKISPAGHWMSIAKFACADKGLDIQQSIVVYMTLAVTQFDSFISCWDTKYRYNLIRPVTYINNYINPTWLPELPTPGFPEYTSGHSCTTGGSSQVLTYFLGDNYSFTDSTEFQFGLGARTYSSFNEAADEASISRFYGGIHYKRALFLGLKQGRSIADHIIERIGNSENITRNTVSIDD